jgi:hypothetical protein
MKPPMNLSGQRFGRLLAYIRKRDGCRVYYKCLCDCGNFTTVAHSALRGGTTQSCGCLQREMASKANWTHRQFGTSTYRTWAGMLGRCLNPKNPAYGNYGGRGITVCERWLQFENFFADMGARPSPELSLDRIDNDGNYEPGNCRWATREQQHRNRRVTIWVTVSGVKMICAEASKELGIPNTTFHRWCTMDKAKLPPHVSVL